MTNETKEDLTRYLRTRPTDFSAYEKLKYFPLTHEDEELILVLKKNLLESNDIGLNKTIIDLLGIPGSSLAFHVIREAMNTKTGQFPFVPTEHLSLMKIIAETKTEEAENYLCTSVKSPDEATAKKAIELLISKYGYTGETFSRKNLVPKSIENFFCLLINTYKKEPVLK